MNEPNHVTPQHGAPLTARQKTYTSRLNSPGNSPGPRAYEKLPNGAGTIVNKQNITNRLLELWVNHPHLRLGQLIANVYKSPYYTYDFDFIAGLEKYYDIKKEKHSEGETP